MNLRLKQKYLSLLTKEQAWVYFFSPFGTERKKLRICKNSSRYFFTWYFARKICAANGVGFKTLTPMEIEYYLSWGFHQLWFRFSVDVNSMASAHGALRVYTKTSVLFNKFCFNNSLKSDSTKLICFSKRLKSTSSVITTDSVESSEQEKFQKDELDLTFENTKDAYKSKTTSELIRALVVLKLSTYDYLVENNKRVSIIIVNFNPFMHILQLHNLQCIHILSVV